MPKLIIVIANGYPGGEHHFYTGDRYIARLVVPTIGRRIVLTDATGHRFDIVRKGFFLRRGRYYLIEADRILARGRPISSEKPGIEYDGRRFHLAEDKIWGRYFLTDDEGQLQLAIARDEPLRCTITNYADFNLALVALVYWLVLISQ